MAKKKKRSPEKMHRQIQDSVQALPYIIDDHRKNGRWFKAFMLRFVSGPLLRLTNRLMSARRYRGEEGAKRKQTDRMRRHLEHRNQALQHMQTHMQQQQKQQRKQRKR